MIAVTMTVLRICWATADLGDSPGDMVFLWQDRTNMPQTGKGFAQGPLTFGEPDPSAARGGKQVGLSRCERRVDAAFPCRNRRGVERTGRRRDRA